MTTPSLKLEAFALAAREGRTPEPLDILGQECLVKLANADTNGAAAVFHLDAPPMSGPPLHRHSREDEWFYVLEGEVTVEVDGSQSVLSVGGSAFAPRGTAHTFQNFGPAGARMLVMVTPGGFDQFLRALSALNKPLPAPDFTRTEQILKEYGLELLGPPLS
jgi:mannose-6-phosphate isomerase-like protein (cupin superfamily)